MNIYGAGSHTVCLYTSMRHNGLVNAGAVNLIAIDLVSYIEDICMFAAAIQKDKVELLYGAIHTKRHKHNYSNIICQCLEDGECKRNRGTDRDASGGVSGICKLNTSPMLLPLPA